MCGVERPSHIFFIHSLLILFTFFAFGGIDTLTAVAGFLSGLIGAMGMGGGGVLLIYLTVFAACEQLNAQGINLLFFLPTGMIAILIYAAKKRIMWKTVLIMWLGGAVGATLGYLLARTIGTDSLGKLFACFLIIFGVCQLFSRNSNAERQKSK